MKELVITLIALGTLGSVFAQSDQEITHYGLLGGNEFDAVSDLLFDSTQDNYLFSATTNSSNLPLEGNSFQSFSAGDFEAFFGRIDAGGDLIYSSYIGGSDIDFITAVDILPNGDFILGGYTQSSDFPLENAHNDEFSGDGKGWMAKFDGENNLIWSTLVGGNGDLDNISDLVSNNQGEIFIVGGTQSTDLGTTGVFQENNLNPEASSFLAKYDENGFPIWYTYISDEIDSPGIAAITLSPDQETIYVVGSSDPESSLTFDNSSHQAENAGFLDAVLFSFSAQDGTLNWGTFYGGEKTENQYDIQTTSDGSVIVAGSTSSATNISTPGALNEELIENSIDIFLTAFDENGTQLWGTYLGSDVLNVTTPYIDTFNNDIYLSVITSSNSLSIVGNNPLVPEVDPVSSSTSLGYIAKITNEGTFEWSSYSNPDYECSHCRIIEAKGDGSFACLGSFPSESDNAACLDNLSSDAYQTEYGGGNADMALFFYNDNTLSVSATEVEPLSLYPNPASQFVTIELPEFLPSGIEITVTDLSGRTVDRLVGFQSGNSYNTHHLADGVYILTGRAGEKVFREKLVVTE